MINRHYTELANNYLFSEIGRRVAAYTAEHPDNHIIRMGIGDVTQPLCAAAVDAMKAAADEMGTAAGFHGYGPEQGYAFLREAVAAYYGRFGVELAGDEIFISDGAKSDVGNILDIFDTACTVSVPDPVYPVYVDTNVMAGRRITYLNATPENGFLPRPDEGQVSDLIYLCSPNNPCGVAYDRAGLTEWVEFARAHGSVILFDAAYESFIQDANVPHSIYEIPGARECAIEFCSLSKTAGFTGTRCGYTIVPHALQRDGVELNHLWLRRQTTKFNGVSYVVQRGAAAVLSEEGQRQTAAQRAVYQQNARCMAETMEALGLRFYGAVNSPYVWMACPGGMDSWTFFDRLLHEVEVVGTPGAGFGKNGEGYFRLTAFSTVDKTREAMERLARFVR